MNSIIDKRIYNFKRNEVLEKLLVTINDSLSCAESFMLNNLSSHGLEHPIVFIMGPHRSGTTLFLQWLASLNIVAYPTNLLSRFYGAPVVGAHIQLMLTDPVYYFRNEISEFDIPRSFESNNGKTVGALSPNEFWHFWRRYLPFKELDWLSDDELLRVVDRKTLVRELMTLTKVFNKPFALKAMILNYNIPFLNRIFKSSLFIQIKRDPVANVASAIDARKKQHGETNTWYSFRIPEYTQLKDLNPISQCAGQVTYINKAVTAGMATVDDNKKMVIQYEDFCRNPYATYEELTSLLNIDIPKTVYSGPHSFTPTRIAEIPNRPTIEKALSLFSHL